MNPWEWWRSIGSPTYVASPMVDQSELAFRMMLRNFHTSSSRWNEEDEGGVMSVNGKEVHLRKNGLLCYTPMLHSAKFVSDRTYRSQRFATCPAERTSGGGLVAQFCGHDPATLLAAAKLVEGDVDAVDLNLGNYGSYLLRQGDLVEGIVQTWAAELRVPAMCKVRLLDMKSARPDERGLQGSINFCKRLEAAGAFALCVHGRTREQKGLKTGTADWHAIAAVKRAVGIPIIANGGVETPADVIKCLEVTGADAVMSAEALLEFPTLFNDCVSGRSIYDHDYRASYGPHFKRNYRTNVDSTLHLLEGTHSDFKEVGPLECVSSTAQNDLIGGTGSGGGGLDMPRPTTYHTPTGLAFGYLDLAAEHPPPDFYKCVKAHALKLLHRPLALATLSASLQNSSKHMRVSSTSVPSSGEKAMTVTPPPPPEASFSASSSDEITSSEIRFTQQVPPVIDENGGGGGGAGAGAGAVAVDAVDADHAGCTGLEVATVRKREQQLACELAAEAKEAVMSASDSSELRAAIHLLEAFMRKRCSEQVDLETDEQAGQNSGNAGGYAQGCRCGPILRSELYSVDLLQTNALSGPLSSACATVDDKKDLCECWRQHTWYRRHRQKDFNFKGVEESGDVVVAPGAEDTSENARAATVRRKDWRRERYRALGFKI